MKNLLTNTTKNVVVAMTDTAEEMQKIIAKLDLNACGFPGSARVGDPFEWAFTDSHIHGYDGSRYLWTETEDTYTVYEKYDDAVEGHCLLKRGKLNGIVPEGCTAFKDDSYYGAQWKHTTEFFRLYIDNDYVSSFETMEDAKLFAEGDIAHSEINWKDEGFAHYLEGWCVVAKKDILAGTLYKEARISIVRDYLINVRLLNKR